jgi:hypothetical protein
VFSRPMVELESIDALRKSAAEAVAGAGDEQAAFPAEDTPAQVPREVERLRGDGERPVRA